MLEKTQEQRPQSYIYPSNKPTPKTKYNDKKLHDLALTPYKYPTVIKYFFYTTILIFLTVSTHFFTFLLPKHYHTNQLIQKAEQYLNNKQYFDAINIYSNLLEQFPKTKTINTKLLAAQLGFYSYNNDIDSFIFLINQITTLKKEDFSLLQQHIAPDFLDSFNSCFKTSIRFK